MTDLALAVVLGGALGLGICLLLSRNRRWGAQTLSQRVAPYIRDVTDPVGTSLVPVAPVTSVGALWPWLQDRALRISGGREAVERRLKQADWTMDAGGFRGRQLLWAIAGVAFGGVVLIALVMTGRAHGIVVLLPPLFGLAGAVLCDVRLTRAARARMSRIEEELPTVLEFLALCLSAGEGLLDSLRRVGDVGAGELTAEVRAVAVAVGTGSSLSDALTGLSRRVDLAPLSRAIDQLVAAIDRGAPLAGVLHAQALDAREDAKRALIERAGRNEIAMLVPLVFLILPLSVLFAVFPGIFLLRLGIG